MKPAGLAALVALAVSTTLGDARAEGANEARADSGAEAAATFPVRIDAIRVLGLVRTKPHVVRRELGFAEGDVVTKAAFDLAVTRLWNTSIFARVEGDVVREADTAGNPRAVAVFQLEDRWTLNPLFRFGSGGDATFFRLGAADNNVAGRFLEVQAQYENFDGFHGGQAIFRDPRLFERRLELAVQVDRLVRPRGGFSDQRTQGIVELSTLLEQDRVRIGARASVFASRFLAPLEGPRFFPLETETALLEPALRVGRIDTVRLRQRGASVELRPAVGLTTSDVTDAYAGATLEGLGFAMLGARWNVAVRARASGVSKVPPHLMLYAGGLDLLRGFPDNFVRTNALALANAEMRFIAFDSTWIALVPTAFVDAAAARSPSGAPGAAVAVGAGLRVLVPKFVGTGLRVDFAVPVYADLAPVRAPDQARFGPVTPAVDVGTVQPNFGVFQFF
jgi:hypothetical protein